MNKDKVKDKGDTSMEKFLAVNKEYFAKGLQAIDILILSQVEEYNRNGCDCYLTNEQLSKMFGATLYAVKTSLDKLENLKYISRKTTYVEGNGKANRQRVIKMVGCPTTNQTTENENGRLKNENGRLKNEEWKVDSQPIKENIKENKKITRRTASGAANAEEEKWIPTDDSSNKIFGSPIHSDVRMIGFIKEEFEDSQSKDSEQIASIPCFWGSNTEAIIEYIETILS